MALAGVGGFILGKGSANQTPATAVVYAGSPEPSRSDFTLVLVKL